MWILPSNKVHFKLQAYGTLEWPPLNRGWTPFSGAIEQSTPFVRHSSHFWLHIRGSQFFVRYLRILLTWLSLGHDSNTMSGITSLHNGMILSTLNINSHSFFFFFNIINVWKLIIIIIIIIEYVNYREIKRKGIKLRKK